MLLPEGSWGENNNHDVWSNESNKWTWEAIYNDELRLNNILQKSPVETLTQTQREVLTQALRELMLLQSSDWQFLIHTESAKDYSEQRFMFHHSDFNKLCDIAENIGDSKVFSANDKQYLDETMQRNSVFPELQLEWWKD
jgi:1,4-alpha-glucan branching enzyme